MGLLSLLKSKESLERDKLIFQDGIEKLDESSRRAVQMRIDEINYKIRDTDILIKREKEKVDKFELDKIKWHTHNNDILSQIKKSKNNKLNNYSNQDKINYYNKRKNDSNLTEQQREFAKNRIKQLNLK